MQPSTKTTVGATVAGGAFGTIVAWGLGLATGVPIPEFIGGAFATLGGFAFGVIFPRSL